MKLILLFLVILTGCKAAQKENMWQLQWNIETKEVREILPEKGATRYLIKNDSPLSESWVNTTKGELLKNGIDIEKIGESRQAAV